MICHRLGFIRSDEGDYEECERLYRQSVKIAEENGLSKSMLATGLHLVGVIQYHRCCYDESVKYLEQALNMRLDENETAVSVTKRRLAATLRRMGRLDEAEERLTECLKVDRKTGNERNTARSLRQLGMVYRDRGSAYDEEAMACFEESHAISHRIDNKKGIACVLTNLGELKLRQNRDDEAEEDLSRSLTMAMHLRSRYGMAVNHRWMGEICLRRSEYDQVVEHLLKALEQFELLKHLHVEDACRLLAQALLASYRRKIEIGEAISSGVPLVVTGKCVSAAQDRYEELWRTAEPSLRKNEPEIDEHLNNLGADQRLGLSVIIRPSEEIGGLLKQVSDHLREFARAQYYYDAVQYHVTVITLIEARESFHADEDLLSRYRKALSDILLDHRPFRIQLRGIGGSQACIFAKGFFADDSLNEIREHIRNECRKRDLQTEERYPAQGAHINLMRFRSKNGVEKVAREVGGPRNGGLRECELGVFQVSELELVTNDWYMREDKVEVIETFELH